MQILFKTAATTTCLVLQNVKVVEVVVESAFLWEVRTSFKNILYIYTYAYIIYHISIITVNLPRYFHNTLSVENQLMVSRFSPILRWALRCESRLPCRRSFYPWISWVSGKPGGPGAPFWQTFWKGLIRSSNWTHHGGVKLDVNV